MQSSLRGKGSENSTNSKLFFKIFAIKGRYHPKFRHRCCNKKGREWRGRYFLSSINFYTSFCLFSVCTPTPATLSKMDGPVSHNALCYLFYYYLLYLILFTLFALSLWYEKNFINTGSSNCGIQQCRCADLCQAEWTLCPCWRCQSAGGGCYRSTLLTQR